MRRIEELLARTVKLGASDLHFKTDTGKVYVRILGELRLIDDITPMFDEEFRKEIIEVLRPGQWEKFEEELELDFAFEILGVSRFRGNIYMQRGHVQAAFRVIPYDISTMADLGLPQACYDFIERPRGLILVTGPAGSGKSTTLAAMVDHLNTRTQGHIMTVEDPIEFVHPDKRALINQRELGEDTLSFNNALKYVLRQDPDIILVGEMRDLETIHLAITAAETGHLVFATLHTVDAVQTIDRIVDVFPTFQQQQVRMQLSVNLVGIVSQTLVRRKDGRGRAAAFEIMNATNAVRNLIRENKSFQISSILQTGSKQKMQTLDQSLVKMVEQGIISLEDARHRAKDRGEFDRLLNYVGNVQAKAVGAAGQVVGPAAAASIPSTAPANPQNQPPIQRQGPPGQPNRPIINRPNNDPKKPPQQ